MNDHAGVPVSEPRVQGVQLSVPSIDRSRRWRLVRIGGVDAHERRQSAGLRHAVVLRFSNTAKAYIPVRQYPLMLGVEKNLQERQVGFEQARGFGGFHLQQLPLHVAHQHLCCVQRHMTLACSKAPFFGQLPRFLPSLIALNRSSVFLNEEVLEQVSHRSADIGWMLGAGLGDTGASEGRRNHVAVRPFIVGQQMKQHPVLGCDVHLGDVARHVSGCLPHVFKTLFIWCGGTFCLSIFAKSTLY